MSEAQKQASIAKFEKWSDLESHSLDYYLSFINLNKQTLQKNTVRKAAGFGDKVLKKDGNEDVRTLFFAFEDTIVTKLREAGLLPLPVADTSSAKQIPADKKSAKPIAKVFDQDARNNALNARRVAELEKENLDLKNQIKELEADLEGAEQEKQDNERHRETIEVMNEVNAVL
jgi:hypothetical protein